MMAPRKTYAVQVAGITRHLPLFEVAPGVTIAVFNMLGDTEVVKAAAGALVARLAPLRFDVIVTPEAKSIPLAFVMSDLTGVPYVVLRKTYKSYMGQAISSETVSITTGRPQTLYLDQKDKARIKGAAVLLVDDVISTGSTLQGMEELIAAAGGTIQAIAAVFTEGENPRADIIALGNLPVFLDDAQS